MTSGESMMGTLLLGVALAFLNGQVVWADLTLRTSLEAKFSPLLRSFRPENIKKQIAEQIPDTIMEIKGDKVSIVVSGIQRIVDYTANRVVLIDAAARRYTVISLEQYAAALEAAQKKAQTDAPMPEFAKGMNSKVDSKRTGQLSMVQGIEVEETLIVLNVEAPESSFPGSLTAEMHYWTATRSAMNSLPQLKEWASYAARAKGPLDPLNIMQQFLAPFPDVGDALRVPMDAIQKNDGPVLKMQLRLFSPEMRRLSDLVRQTGQALSAGTDPGGTLGDINIFVTNISTDSIPDSVFEVPSGFQLTSIGTSTPIELLPVIQDSDLSNSGRPTLRRHRGSAKRPR